MSDTKTIAFCGLPESGKTTYLAALWHLVTENVDSTALRFSALLDGDHEYLNEIATAWREAKQQKRTDLKSAIFVKMNLVDRTGKPVGLSIPDLSGEAYARMWEKRICDKTTAGVINDTAGLLLFINVANLKYPTTIMEETLRWKKSGHERPTFEQEVNWDARLAPTQVQLVDILQSMYVSPLNAQVKRVAVLLTAWDIVLKKSVTPSDFLREELCLLNQFLENTTLFKWKVYGVSAQGDDLTNAAKLTEVAIPSHRIIVDDGTSKSHDLSEPIAWLSEQ